MEIAKIDKNFKLDTNLERENLKFFSCRNKPFKLYGLYKPEISGKFRRMPEDVAKSVSEGVYYLSTNTAGARVKFQTDSTYIAIHAKFPNVARLGHMALNGTSGFDLYADNIFSWSFVPPVDMISGYENIMEFKTKKMREITINFPLYNDVEELYIGLDCTSQIIETKGYDNSLPIVFYGSSITQGACASRPGTSYQSLISTKYNVDYINLGFSGNAKGELEMANYLKEISASAFVYDYDHNAPTAEHLQETHERLFKIYREKNKDVPVVFISRPSFDIVVNDNTKRRKVIMKTYLNALESGDENVYFIDGETFYAKERRDAFSVDLTHPNDTGFYQMAKIIGYKLEQILKLT